LPFEITDKIEVSARGNERKYPQRYMKCLADRFQLKICEGKQKEKSHRTFKIVLHISIRFQLMQSISFALDEHSLYRIKIHFGQVHLHLFG